tara:strand:+ start:372 stop:623 length:252 start_codon:yes stop_codon:yes gene_type:complete
MKTWLKGGLIGAGIYVINALVVLIYCSFSENSWCGLLGIFKELGFLAIPLIAFNLIGYFIIGAVIGWIVQKIKQQKEVGVAGK